MSLSSDFSSLVRKLFVMIFFFACLTDTGGRGRERGELVQRFGVITIEIDSVLRTHKYIKFFTIQKSAYVLTLYTV